MFGQNSRLWLSRISSVLSCSRANRVSAQNMACSILLAGIYAHIIWHPGQPSLSVGNYGFCLVYLDWPLLSFPEGDSVCKNGSLMITTDDMCLKYWADKGGLFSHTPFSEGLCWRKHARLPVATERSTGLTPSLFECFHSSCCHKADPGKQSNSSGLPMWFYPLISLPRDHGWVYLLNNSPNICSPRHQPCRNKMGSISHSSCQKWLCKVFTLSFLRMSVCAFWLFMR